MPHQFLAALALSLGVSAATAQILSVPPAIAPATAPSPKSAPATLLLPDSQPSYAIVLAAPNAPELAPAAIKSSAPNHGKAPTRQRRVTVGMARDLPSDARAMPLSSLPWADTPGGMRAARIAVTSPGAAGLRIAISLTQASPQLSLRFRGSAPGATVYGPIAADRIAATSPYWTPLLDGDTAIIELAVPRGVSLAGATIDLPMLSHLSVTTGAMKQADPVGAIGRSDSCESDVACVASPLSQQAATAIKATARILLVDHGTSYLCTGTLVNDSTTSLTPYFYTANHCIDNGDADPAASKGQPAAVAQSFETFWMFQANTCGVDTANDVNFTDLTAGTTLLARSLDYDWTLVRLNEPPPPGVTFSAWNAAGPLANGTAANGIHHPEGDLKKFSQGSVNRYHNYSDGSSFIAMLWSRGVTEAGSSGSGLFTLNAAQTFLELRGGLWGGESLCTNTSGLDDYSRLDVALPLLAPYLTPGATNAAKTAPALEFYNATLDDYFVTAAAAEISDLDNGVHPGWVRTGLRFLVYTDPAVAPASAAPVCRFYVSPAYGDSHFYSASPDECAATAMKFPVQWVYESSAVFYIALPDTTTGACPAGTRGIFRFVSDANGLHHRYTAEVDVRDSTIQDGGWTQEGYGTPPNAPVMCTPTS